MQPGIHRITDCLVRVTPYVHNTRDAVVVFFGTLSNLPDLVARRREFRGARTSSGSPPAGASGTWLSSSPPGHVSGGASHGSEATGTGAQTTSCLLDMYKHFADGRELLLLSELQVCYHGEGQAVGGAEEGTQDGVQGASGGMGWSRAGCVGARGSVCTGEVGKGAVDVVGRLPKEGIRCRENEGGASTVAPS